ncbi:hypothetical protein ACS7SF_21795 (plasmid) [Ralstonia sp. 25C]|uniref:hypothetical protein n=1 Tax=Ralstonia sp. 25C TaxID=3447363 RepID=UPI003F751DD3
MVRSIGKVEQHSPPSSPGDGAPPPAPQRAPTVGRQRPVDAPLALARRGPAPAGSIRRTAAPHSAVPNKRPRLEVGASSAAASSSGAPARKPTKMSAALIAAALKMLADDPMRPLVSIGADLDSSAMAHYVAPGGALRQEDRVRAFPDFEAHADAITASLRRLGHGEQADALAALGPAVNTGRERQALTAQRVHQLLGDRLAGKPVSDKTLARWQSPPTWQREDLATRLAKLPDYADWRGRIETQLRQLGVIGQDARLPEPAAARTVFDAHILVACLRVIRQRAQAKAEGRRDDPSLKGALYDLVDAKKDHVLAWVNADGRLRKPATNVSRLPGYAEERDEIVRLLNELGHTETAAAMPLEATRAQEIGADTIAQFLAKIAADPKAQRGATALTLGVAATSLAVHIAPDNRLKQLHKIADMPGYAEHAQALGNALRALGHADQAALLPAPPQAPAAPEDPTLAKVGITADDFLHRVGNHLHQVAEVARRMRDEQQPNAAMFAVAQEIGVSRAWVRALLDERGAVRDRPVIEQMLEGVDTHASARLGRLLERLRGQIEGAADAPSSSAAAEQSNVSTSASARPAMKALQIGGAGHAPDRVLIVKPNTVDPGPNVPKRLAEIYRPNRELVHPPRNYEPDRQRQPLRWLSSMLRQRFPKSVEVQCYFDATRRSVVVSSNVSTVNEEIRSFLASAEFERLLAKPAPSRIDNQDRLARHQAKLLRRMDPASDPHVGSASDAVLAAIAERRFEVPTRTYPVDLHAERRINDHMVSKHSTRVETEQLAGTMRPCSSCADELEAKPEVHRGPAWLSRAGRMGFDHDENVDRQMQAGIGTSITRSRKNRLTFEHDTDSDSDA